ncbi:hypothetical protein [Microbacterium sp. LWH3-1.2]|uniref:hypothetical protein n=1 Tax=Microbacterium sp. LWH3-1.2 TaxID=3135256 RepID=UPI003424E16F
MISLTSRPSRWIVAGYVPAVVLLWMGVSQVASLAGEVPVYGPTASEDAVWTWGRILGWTGAIALIAWGVLVAAFWRRSGYTRGAVILVIMVGFFLAIVGKLVVWMVTLPPLLES